MADNVSLPPATGKAASRDVTYSGESAQAQAVGIVTFSGSDDAKTAVDVPSGSGTSTGALRVELPTNGTGIVGLAAGTNGIGKLTANSGVDIGDVDVASVVPGTGATNLGKAEGGGHTTGDTGVVAFGVRNDADASFGSDLQYCPQSTDAGGNVNVKNRRDLVRISVASTSLTTAATAYTAGDQVATEFTLAGAARASGGGGTIVGVLVVSAADTTGPFHVVFTNASITLAGNDAAYAISDADALKIQGLVQCAANYDIGNNRIAQAFNLSIPYVCAATSLFASLITPVAIAATPFGANSDIQLIVYVERN